MGFGFYDLGYLPPERALDALGQVASIGGEQPAALGAGLGQRLEVGGEGAIGVVAAAVKGAFLLVLLLHYVAAALGTLDADLYLEGLGEFAVGVAAAGYEFAEAPELDYHRLAALGADLVGGFLHRYLFHFLGGALQALGEGGVKLLDDRHPVLVLISDLV